MNLSHRFSFAVAVFLLLAASVVAVGCTTSSEEPVTQDIVAPPLVPDAPPPSVEHVVVRLEATEVEAEIAPGVLYTMWTFNNTVPGPFIRVHEGDTVEIRLTNSGSSTIAHNIDLHAVNGPGGGAEATNVAPGETKSFTFKALSAGLFTYHCAAGLVADHIANGMYGGILVEPRNGLPRVDREYYVGQSDMYTNGETNEQGSMQLDFNKLLAEQPTYVVFNGHTQALRGDGVLQAEVGETVRIYFVDGGPNLTSSFHVIGEIFDRAWAWGSLESQPVRGVQTISVPPGGGVIVEFKVDVPGDYILVDHALGRVAKGASGILRVTGDGDPDIFDGGESGGGGHDMGVHTPGPGAEPGEELADGETVTVEMSDNAFEPNQFTVPAGATVTFDLPNVGVVPHNMRIAGDTAGDYESAASTVSTPQIVGVGVTGVLTWTAPSEAGSYPFRCDIHPVDMVGTITVQ